MTHVLIVDDELGIRETFQVFLEDEGYEVSTAASFFEAEPFLTLALMPSAEKAGSVDVVIADVVLPRINGLVLLQRIRQIDEDIPVIMITGEPDLSTAAEAVRYGAYDYISKPVTQEMLLRVVGRAAERKRLLDEKRRLERENWAYQAELERKVAERTAELEQRNRELGTLIEIGQDISSTLDLEQVLRRVTRRVAQVCESHRCTILLLTEEGKISLPLASRSDQSAEELEGRGSFVEEGYYERVMELPEVQQVFRDRRLLFVDTDSASQMLRDWFDAFGVKSLFVFPVVSKERVIGLMALDHVEKGRTFTPEQRSLALGIAAQAAVAIENARLHGEVERRLKEMTALHETTLDITAQLEMPRLLSAIIARASDLLGATGGLVCLYEEEREKLVVVASYNLADDYTGLALDLGEGLAGRVFQSEEPLIVDDYASWHGGSTRLGEQVTRSVLSVPLKWREQTIGVLNIMDDLRTGAFSEQDTWLLVPFANQAAIAIANARLFQKERRHASLLAVVSQVAQQIVSILDLDQILQETVIAISQHFDYDNAILCLIDETRNELELMAAAGSFEELLRLGYRQAVGQGIMGWTAETGQSYVANDVSQDPLYISAYLGEDVTSSELCVPLKLSGRVIGVLDIQDTRPNAFDHADLVAMKLLADQIAAAIENAQLYEAVKRHVDELVALHNIDVAITSILDSDEVLRVIYEQVQEVMDFTSFFIGLYNGEEDRMYLSVVAEEGELLPPISYKCLHRGGLSSWVVHNRKPLWIDDLEEERDSLPAQAIHEGASVRSLMLLPLIVQERVVGVISAQSKEPHAFDEGDRRLFSGIAGQVAIAIHNAQLFEALNRRLAETRLLQEVMQAAASTLDFDEVLARTIETLYKALHDTLHITRLTFALPDDDGEGLTIHPSRIGSPVESRVPLDKSVSGQVFRTGEPQLISDVREEQCYFERALERGSELVVPVKVAEEVIAILNVGSPEEEAFSEDDLHLFSSIAAQLGVVLDKTKLYRRLEKQTAELLQAYNELQETTRLRTELVQNVGHELRTPLSLIQGYTELLLEGELGPILEKQRDALGTIQARAAHLARLIYNLTMLQNVPRMSLKLGRLSMVDVVRQAIKEFRNYAKDSGIVFREALPDDIPPVYGDRERLQLVVGHLVENAVKFSPDGGTVTIRAWADAEYVYVSVSDEGIGIPIEHLDRIFERFYQVDGSASRRFGGMGVGLALVWEIVEAHGGSVEVDSDPGKGSTFTVILPQASSGTRSGTRNEGAGGRESGE